MVPRQTVLKQIVHLLHKRALLILPSDFGHILFMILIISLEKKYFYLLM